MTKDFSETCRDFCLPVDILQLVHQKEMLQQLASSHASQCYCTVPRQSDVHIEHMIRIDFDDFIHLIVQLVQESEWKSVA